MKADVYVSNIKRVIPIYHATKSRKLKQDVNSQSEQDSFQQVFLTKKKQRVHEEEAGLRTYVYTIYATEDFLADQPQFDSQA
ncbi:hypothetical protein [[Clostridium] polysaccharolyticum]|jgi:hypothetical protein|uniref:Uncharacterized protein n=1 Tax=[Clostridium] polysaccharolyticum TaxID=29364 RepID=A0A1I0FMS4_9FIRM|nr:hypothetical protein [[Clostridium] polysaccharolyticum]SET59546.1 hypothetical protein SAMN04487772_1344 [[Clostridium] polysaccharolyticum]